MPASNDTVKQILDVLERHMPDRWAIRKLVIDLYKNVKGNKSVMATLEKLNDATMEYL